MYNSVKLNAWIPTLLCHICRPTLLYIPMSDTPPKQLDFEWELGATFLEAFEDGAAPTISTTLKSPGSVEVGCLYSLLLRFEDRETDFQLHATLLSLKGNEATFEFLREERQRLELVLVSARGESLPYRRRRHTRIPCQLAVQIALRGNKQTATTTNLGGGGTHILLETPIDVDEQIELTIILPEGHQLELVGRVTSRIDEGPERGSSVEFLFRSAAQRDEVAAVTSALKADTNP